MITIHKPVVYDDEYNTKMIADIDVDDEKRQIWVSVDKEYGEYLCSERADAYLIALLPYALLHKHDIVCESPITAELLYNIKEVLLPTLIRSDKSNYSVKINAASESCVEKIGNGGVGTGLSCGVDSFHSVAKNWNSPYENQRLTHVAVYNVGSFNEIYKNTGLDYVQRKTWERAETVANELSLPIVRLNSNIHQAFPQNHLWTHTYTDVFAVYCLQKLWKTYYYASAYSFEYFHLDNNLHNDCSRFELLLLSCLSTSSLKIYLEGAQGDRTDKVAYISDFPIAQKYLHVCTSKEVNCGYCEKCMRTMLSMDALGKLDNFEESFDIDLYHKEKERYYRFLCEQHALHNEMYKSTFNLLYPKHRAEFDKYMSEMTFEYQLRKAKSQTHLVNIWRSYTNMFINVLDNEKLKQNFTAYFKKNNIRKIAFYGDGEIRRYLYSIIKDIKSVEVIYLVEDGKFDWLPFPSYARVTFPLPETDLMIITDVLGSNSLKTMLTREYTFQIFTAEEFLEEGNKKHHELLNQLIRFKE